MEPAWKIHERETERAAELVRCLGVSEVIAHLLVRMGYEHADSAKGFLDPALNDLHDPKGLPGIADAVARLSQAIDAQEPILLFGDYDVDGSTGAAVLEQVLAALGATVEVHIPNRTEGYGINTDRLGRAADDGVKVVVSIDNGIAAIDEAKFLAERGVDLIVVDHHTLIDEGRTLPIAAALVHPRLPGSTYPNPHLCGAGVAFKVAWALAVARHDGDRASAKLRKILVRCMALVALGTVADVVSLTGENRILVRHGLRVIASLAKAPDTPCPGLAELCRVSRVDGLPDTTDVGFRLAPRLNAAGRMGDARRAYELLTTTDPERARVLAEELDEENKRRRDLQTRVFRAAKAQVEEVYGEEPGAAAGIVAYGEDWPHGIVGIVAAKLTEVFHRPALVVSIEGETAKGSGRSVDDVDLLASLEPHRDLFVRCGGHAAAVGFTIETARLGELREAFSAGVKASLGLAVDAGQGEVEAAMAGFEVVADVEVALDEVSTSLLNELERLSPFGQGNPEPLFAVRDVTLVGEPRLMGATGQHVSFQVKQNGRVLRTVAFGRPELWDLLQERATDGPNGKTPFEVAFRPRLNRWQGTARVELQLEAIRFTD